MTVCVVNKSVLTNTIYRHKRNRRFTWLSPDRVSRNQIDYTITSQDNKKIIKNSRSYQSADLPPHSRVIANVQLKGKLPKRPRMKGTRHDVGRLVNDQKVPDSFKVTIRASVCTTDGAWRPRNTVSQLYEKFKNETNRITERTLGIMRNQKTEGLEKEFENLYEQRRDARLAYIKDPKNTNTNETYKSLNKAVKQEIFIKEILGQKI